MRKGLVGDTRVFLGTGSRIDFVDGLGASGDRNRRGWVGEGGTEGESTERDYWWSIKGGDMET